MTARAPLSERAACLRRAEALTTGPREEQYGEMVPSMQRVARMWSAFLDFPISASDVCRCMALLKDVRSKHSPLHRDSHDDAVAYRAMAWECELAEPRK